jgi:hypothetical protein
LVNGKHFPVKEKFGLIFRKIFFFYFRRKTLSRNYKKFKNIILFADYVKFGPQTFDCYIFYLNPFFSNLSLKFWFNFIFILTLVLIFIILFNFLLSFFKLKFFIYQIWSSFFWLLLILFKIIYKIIIIIILISPSFNFFICQIWYLLFWLLFILFKIIYEIRFFLILFSSNL